MDVPFERIAQRESIMVNGRKRWRRGARTIGQLKKIVSAIKNVARTEEKQAGLPRYSPLYISPRISLKAEPGSVEADPGYPAGGKNGNLVNIRREGTYRRKDLQVTGKRKLRAASANVEYRMSPGDHNFVGFNKIPTG